MQWLIYATDRNESFCKRSKTFSLLIEINILHIIMAEHLHIWQHDLHTEPLLQLFECELNSSSDF